MIEITVNGVKQQTSAKTLAHLLAEMGFEGKLATARNGAFVARPLRERTELSQGDAIEVLAAMQGG